MHTSQPRTDVAEVLWVIREARALQGSTDQERIEAFLARKKALLAHIESTTGAAPEDARVVAP